MSRRPIPARSVGTNSWCWRSSDGTLFCRRTGEGPPRLDQYGAPFWVTFPTGQCYTGPLPDLPPLPPRADADTLDAVYRFLLARLPLAPRHREDLRTRGVSDTQFEQLGYRTLERGGREGLGNLLLDEFGEDVLQTVPGYRRHKGRPWLGGFSGMVFPIRDLAGRVGALSVRSSSKDHKYTWVSSKAYGGPGPGSPVHVPLCDGDRRVVRVTEGSLKSDIATALSSILTLGMPGTSGPWPLLEILREIGPEVVLLAYDADAEQNQHVARAQARAWECLRMEGYVVEVERWDRAQGKGVDDIHAAGVTPERLTGADAEAHVAGNVNGARPPNAAVYEYTDLGNAYRLAERHGDKLLYCDLWKCWLTWDDKRWTRDQQLDVETYAHETIERLYQDAWKTKDKEQSKFALKCQSDRAITAMVKRARALARFKAMPEQFDGQPWLFNVENGTIDLKTGRLRDHRREDYLTQLCPVAYDPTATAPTWERFLLDIMAGNRNLVAFLCRAVGYCLTGIVSERVLFVLWGGGANGKSTFLDIIRRLLADYGHKLRREALALGKLEPGRPCPEVAGLRGKRFAYLSETKEGGQLDEALVKELTGGEYLRTRDLHEKEFGFSPEFHLWVGTNHKPVIRGTDEAIRDRLPLIPFPVRFVEAPNGDLNNPLVRPMDKELAGRLAEELPGILAWAVRGCLEWQRGGLAMPDEVRDATDAYHAEMDFIEAFLGECCVRGFDMKCRMKDCHERYTRWASTNEAPALSSRSLTPLIEAKGFTHAMSTGGFQWWSGFGLQEEQLSFHRGVGEVG